MSEEKGQEFPYAHMIDDNRKYTLGRSKQNFEEMNVPMEGNLLIDAQSKGWTVHKVLKKAYKVRKLKSHHLLWEHKVWGLFASYSEVTQMNDLTRKFDLGGIHQVDVFVHSPDQVVLVECKSREKMGVDKKLRTHILEMSGYKEEAEKSIREKYGKNTKISWCIATENFLVTDAYKNLAEQNGITILTQDQITYFWNLFKKSGQVSIYQLFSLLFVDVEFANHKVSVPAFSTRIGGNTAFIFTATASQLLPISYVSHKGNYNPDEPDAFQRAVGSKKLKEIKEFVDNGGYFPNSILLNINTRGKGKKGISTQIYKIDDNKELVNLKLPGLYRTAWIIDGQHRLLSLHESKHREDFSFPVIAFIDLPGSEQANLFVTINNKQKRVNSNLLIELSATLKWGSDDIKEKLSSMEASVMHHLSKSDNSPLKGLIALTGDTQKKPFTTNTIVTAIKRYKPFGSEKKQAHEQGDYWITNQDEDKGMRNSVSFVVSLISEYLSIIETDCENWQETDKKKGRVFLKTNNGVSALIHCMFDFIKEYTTQKGNDITSYADKPSDLIENVGNWIRTLCDCIDGYSNEFLNQMRAWTGLKGQGLIRAKFLGDVSKAHEDFNPAGIDEKLSVIEGLWVEKSDALVDEMEDMITQHVLHVMKENYGEDMVGQFPKWFAEGVPSVVKKAVAERMVENNESIEASFDIMHLYRIIHTNYQDLFMSTYKVKNYPAKGSNNKDKNLSYFEKLNSLRKQVKHKVNKIVEEEDFTHLSELWEKLRPQIEKSYLE